MATQINELIRSAEGHLSLTTPAAAHGNKPLSLAASGPYPQVVRALLAAQSVRPQIIVPIRAGVVEAADIDVMTPDAGNQVAAALQDAIVRALAKYHRKRDFTFMQEFKFAYS